MITLSESAVRRVRELLASDPEAGGKALRLGVKPGGCNGYEYALSFDLPKDGDARVEQGGVTVLVDRDSALFLKGTRLDYAESPTGSEFRFENPNVKSTCGCGKSNKF